MPWTTFFLHILLCIPAWSKIVLERVDNLMLIEQNTNVGINELWNLNKSFNDPSDDKHSKPVYTLITGGNFRSNLLDSWEADPPDEVAMMFFNMLGDLHFWMMFDTKNTSRDLKTWMLPGRFLGSSVAGMYQMIPEWTLNGYEISFTSPINTELSWFAVTEWNIYNGSSGQPFFVFPLVGTDPFKRVQASHKATNGDILLGRYGPFLNNVQQNIQVNLGNVYFLKAIEVITKDKTSGAGKYRLEYSSEAHCNNAAYISYRDTGGNVLDLELDVLVEMHPLQVQCMLVVLQDMAQIIGINVYGPSHFKVDFITVPILVFRGFWYGEENSTVLPYAGSLQSTMTTVFEASTQMSVQHTELTPAVTETKPGKGNKTCACECFHASGNTSIVDIGVKIEYLKKTMTLNKTMLSSHKRRFISVSDDRITAQSIGYVAGVFMCLVLVFIVILDLTSLSKYLLSLKGQS